MDGRAERTLRQRARRSRATSQTSTAAPRHRARQHQRLVAAAIEIGAQMRAVADDDDAVLGAAPAVAAAENGRPLAGRRGAAAPDGATTGVLPRPPIARLPTLMTGSGEGTGLFSTDWGCRGQARVPTADDRLGHETRPRSATRPNLWKTGPSPLEITRRNGRTTPRLPGGGSRSAIGVERARLGAAVGLDERARRGAEPRALDRIAHQPHDGRRQLRRRRRPERPPGCAGTSRRSPRSSPCAARRRSACRARPARGCCARPGRRGCRRRRRPSRPGTGARARRSCRG